MTTDQQRVLYLLSGGAMVLMMGAAVLELPSGSDRDRPLAELMFRAAEDHRVANAVSLVTFDTRGYDTLGEEFLLLAATVGITVLLRAERRVRPEDVHTWAPSRARASSAVRGLGAAWIPVTVLVGLYVVFHGHLSPGGGFQGGVVLATGALLVFLSGTDVEFRRLSPAAMLELAEGLGTGAFALVGLAGLIATGTFLSNLLPLGRMGELLSGGTVALFNVSSGLAVSGGFVLLLSELLQQALFRSRP